MITKKAYAKINLTLEIGDKQEDGYHSLTSVMARATLADTVSVEKNTSGVIMFSSTDSEIDEHGNLCVKAAEKYFKAVGLVGQGVNIFLENNIPLASGMGGGSADCAAVIECMEELFGRLSNEDRHALARSLGADVSYCLNTVPCICTGIGDMCTPINAKKAEGLYLVISKVGKKQSTAKVYADFDALEKRSNSYDHTAAVRALEAGDKYALAGSLFNDFEQVVLPSSPEAFAERERLMKCGALNTVMSGAGPAIVAFFDSYEKASAAGDAVYALMIN